MAVNTEKSYDAPCVKVEDPGAEAPLLAPAGEESNWDCCGWEKGARAFLRARVVLAVAFSQCCVGGYNVVLGYATKDIDPLIFSWLRDVGAVICYMTLLTVTQGKPPWQCIPKNRDIGRFIVYGCMHVYFGQYFMVLAAKNGYPLLTSMWLNTGPIFICMLSVLWGIEKLDLKERSGWLKLSGLLFTVSGAIVYVYIDKKDGKKKGSDLTAAHLYMFFEVTGASVFHTIEKKILRSGYTAIETAAWGYFFGMILLTFVAIPQFNRDMFDFPASNWWLVAYSLFVNSFVSSVAFTWANKKSGPIFVNAFRPLQTIVTALLQWWLKKGHPKPSYAVGVGAAIIIPGVYLLLMSRYFETKGRAHHGDDDMLSGGKLAMRLADARGARRSVTQEVRELRRRIRDEGGRPKVDEDESPPDEW